MSVRASGTAARRVRTRVRRVDRTWGLELVWADTGSLVGKVLFVRANHATSLGLSRAAGEAWLVQGGRGVLQLEFGDGSIDSVEVVAGDALHFEAGTAYRLLATDDLVIVEVSPTQPRRA